MKILFYSDLVPLGGHEIMSALLANELTNYPDFEVFFIGGNNLRDRLNRKVVFIENKIKPRPLNGSFGMFYLKDYYTLNNAIDGVKPDILVSCQGTIELGIKSLILAKIKKIPVISYIPLLIDLLATESKFFPRIRNFINGFFYQIPDAFIGISDFHCQSIKSVSKNKPTLKLTNWIEISDTENTPAFENNDLDGWLGTQKKLDKKVLLIIGRIEFNHKQQDKFIKGMSQFKLRKDVSVLFVGDGGDSPLLKEMLQLQDRNNMFFAGRITNTSQLYEKVDATCICSSFEGVPLVLLESINAKLPIFSFNYPPIKGYLSDDFLVEEQNFKKLFSLINNFDFNDNCSKHEKSYFAGDKNQIDKIVSLMEQLLIERR